MRVDRTDPSKNIVRGFRAFELFLAEHPEWHKRVTMLALLDPSRQAVPEYVAYLEQIERAVSDVNARFGADGWQPVDLQVADNFPQSVAAYKQYDVLLVNAVYDGLNLVAKEGAARQHARRRARALRERGCARGARAMGADRQPVRHRRPGRRAARGADDAGRRARAGARRACVNRCGRTTSRPGRRHSSPTSTRRWRDAGRVTWAHDEERSVARRREWGGAAWSTWAASRRSGVVPSRARSCAWRRRPRPACVRCRRATR